MSNSNEKLVAGLAALIPIARDAFRDGHLDRQFDAVLSNDKVRHAGSQMVGQAEKYLRDSFKGNKLARKLAARLAPKPSPLPMIALAALGAGLVWAYLDRRKANKLWNEGLSTNKSDENKSEPDVEEGVSTSN